MVKQKFVLDVELLWQWRTPLLDRGCGFSEYQKYAQYLVLGTFLQIWLSYIKYWIESIKTNGVFRQTEA